jgi:hypothetical protein
MTEHVTRGKKILSMMRYYRAAIAQENLERIFEIGIKFDAKREEAISTLVDLVKKKGMLI